METIRLGDVVTVINNQDNCARKKGTYQMKVIDEDDKSFAVGSYDKWWFYRDTLTAYVGDAVVIS